MAALKNPKREAFAQALLRNLISPTMNSRGKAAEAAAASIDLMNLRSSELIKQVAELQEATRTGRRRFGYSADTVRASGHPKVDQFEEPLNKVRAAQTQILALYNEAFSSNK